MNQQQELIARNLAPILDQLKSIQDRLDRAETGASLQADDLRAIMREELARLDLSQSLGQLGTPVPTAEKGDIANRKTERELALEWLADHPGDLKRAGRWLESNVRPEGVTISYRTWNRAKADLKH